MTELLKSLSRFLQRRGDLRSGTIESSTKPSLSNIRSPVATSVDAPSDNPPPESDSVTQNQKINSLSRNDPPLAIVVLSDFSGKRGFTGGGKIIIVSQWLQDNPSTRESPSPFFFAPFCGVSEFVLKSLKVTFVVTDKDICAPFYGASNGIIEDAILVKIVVPTSHRTGQQPIQKWNPFLFGGSDCLVKGFLHLDLDLVSGSDETRLPSFRVRSERQAFGLSFARQSRSTLGDHSIKSNDTSAAPSLDLGLLQQRSLSGTELESLYHGRCQIGTRIDHIANILMWRMEPWNPEPPILWLSGHAGVGKSAIAQSMGEFAEQQGFLGARIFFSRIRKIDDSSLFITSIAYQLAGRHSWYRKKIVDIIKDDPTILTTSNKQTQLEKLLIEPFPKKGERSENYLIIVDGLDECEGSAEQQDLVRLIAEAAESPLPFLWMISSRPEPHLKEIFLDEGLSSICRQQVVLLDDPDNHVDLESYFAEELERLGRKLDRGHGQHGIWSAPRDELRKLALAAAGSFVTASSMVRIIADPTIADPLSQLKVILSIIDRPPLLGSSNIVLESADRLYLGVLEWIEKGNNNLSVALEVLGTCSVCTLIPALSLANLHGLTREGFYPALRPLHAFVAVPQVPTDASWEPLRFYHVSFLEFLSDPERSQKFFQDPDRHRSKFVDACILAPDSTLLTKLLPLPPGFDNDNGDENLPATSLPNDLSNFTARNIWDICAKITNPQHELLLKLAAFDFRHLSRFGYVIPVDPFIRFVRWLYQWGKQVPELTHVVRTNHYFETDMKCLERCSSLSSRPLDLEGAKEINETVKSPQYVLAGLEAMTTVIFFIPEAVKVYPIDEIDDWDQ